MMYTTLPKFESEEAARNQTEHCIEGHRKKTVQQEGVATDLKHIIWVALLESS